jgi:hypothetical protein
MSEKWERAGTVIGNANDQLCPAKICTSEQVLVLNGPFDKSTVSARKTLDLGN